jgi:hypothetical protein
VFWGFLPCIHLTIGDNSLSSYSVIFSRRVVPNFLGFFCRFPQLCASGAFQALAIVSGGFGGSWLLGAFCGVLGGLPFWGGFGRVGVGESVGVGWGRSLSVGLGLPVSGNSQESLS